MKRFILLVAFVASLLLSFGCCMGLGHVNSPPRDLVNHLKHSTISLVKESNGHWLPYCGGVWINKNYILTARHCVLLDGEVEIGRKLKFQIFKDFDMNYPYSKNKNVFLAEVVSTTEEGDDLALLKSIDDVEHHMVTVANYRPYSGQQVHHIGHQRGLQFGYLKAYISAERIITLPPDTGNPSHTLNIVGFVWRGSSGGGVFDDYGSLLGISSFSVRAPGQSFFSHLDLIKAFLKKNKIKYNTL